MLQELEAPIDADIVRELIELAPEGWFSIALRVSFSNWGNVERYSHEIYSLDGRTEVVEPSELLMARTYDLGQLFATKATRWKSVTYEVRYVEDVGWKFTASFKYPDGTE